MLVGGGDEDDQVPGQVDAVHVDDPMDLARGLGHRPDPPELGGPPPEGPPFTGHRELRVLREQPC